MIKLGTRKRTMKFPLRQSKPARGSAAIVLAMTATVVSSPQISAAAVKYRGIFIQDEDWGLNPWAAKTFDPQFGNTGPKTYEKVFELMLRLRITRSK